MSEKYEQIKGYVGYQNEDGIIIILSGLKALPFAEKYEPFPIYKKII